MERLPRTKVPRGASLLGMRFGRLAVLSQAKSNDARAGWGSRWFCRCDCGKEKSIGRRDLVSGATISCGCWTAQALGARRFKHGGSYTRTWRSWTGLKQRCLNPANPKYPGYGGRGIAVCDRWLEFSNFLADMGETPAGTSLDRIDVNGNYEPGNCRWATVRQQTDNRRLSAPRVAAILDSLKSASSDLLERAIIDRVRIALLGK